MTCDSSHILVGFRDGSLALIKRHSQNLEAELEISPSGKCVAAMPAADSAPPDASATVDDRTAVAALDLCPEYIACGRESGRVYIWSRRTSRLVLREK